MNFIIVITLIFLLLVIFEKKVLIKKFKIGKVTSNLIIFTMFWLLISMCIALGLNMVNIKTMQKIESDNQWVAFAILTIFFLILTLLSVGVNYLRKRGKKRK